MVSAPRSRSEAAIDQALYNDVRAKTARQDQLETIRTLLIIAGGNGPKFTRINRITQCIVSLSELADVCYTAPRLDIPTSPPSNTGSQPTTNQDITTGSGEAQTSRRSARIAADVERRQQQQSSSSPPADSPHQAVAPSCVTQSTVPRKRKRSAKATTPKTKGQEQKVASHARVGDRKCVKLVARHYLGPRNI